MKQVYITLLLLLYSTFTFAQKDFRKGYIIQNTDTIRGYIDYRGDSRSAQLTTFKPSLNGQEQRYTPGDIAGYGFDVENKVFESKLVPVGDSTAADQQMLFLSMLVKGPASLYYYRDSFSIDRYYLQKDTLFVELGHSEYKHLDTKTGRKYEGYSKKYVGILNYVFLDCQAISMSQLENVRYTHNDLIRVTQKYNQCVTPNAVSKIYANRDAKSKVTIGPVLVYTQADLKFYGDRPIAQADFSNDSHLGGGISVNATLPILNEKLSFKADLLYIPAKFTASYSRGTGNYVIYYDYLFDLAYIKLPLQLRYTYPKGFLRPFVNAGYMMGYEVKSTTKEYISYSYRPDTSEKDAIVKEGFSRYMDGFTAGIGLTHPIQGGNRALSLEIRYERNGDFSKLSSLGTSMNNFNFMLSYGF